jgi:beta-lactamase class C
VNKFILAISVVVMALAASPNAEAASADADATLRLVAREIQALVPEDGAGGIAVAIYRDGQTFFLNHGWADAAREVPITSDSLFNLGSIRKVFEAVLLAQAALRGDLALDDPVSKYVTELEEGDDIRQVTIGELAAYTSGLVLPQDHPPWPSERYTLAEFIRTLNQWKADRAHEPGAQYIYAHSSYVLLQLALERRFGMPIAALLDRDVIRPLGLSSTILPPRRSGGWAALAPELLGRAVQGYGEDGEPIGQPGDQQSYYDFPGTGQMFSSARDLARFLAANLGDLEIDEAFQQALQRTHRSLFRLGPHHAQAMAWEVEDHNGLLIVDKPGGLNNSSTYIGMVPSSKLGIVILLNRGNQHPYELGRRLLRELAHHRMQ